MIDRTHHAATRSWVESANDHPDFPIQNLPMGVFSPPDGAPRTGVAIGDRIVDLPTLAEAGLLPQGLAAALREPRLNPLLALGNRAIDALRHHLFALLEEGSEAQARVEPCLHRAEACTLHLPARIGGYSDFYAGIVHATNVGSLLRPDNPLMPNYKHLPIGYHGRTSSIRPSGTAVRRPMGQLKGPDDQTPRFAPSARLDYEVELGAWVSAGNELGEPIPLAEASDHIAGLTLLNDWSARDIQAWEYQPLGPFLAKNFATTVSPWLVTLAALAPFRRAPYARPTDDPTPLPYLVDDDDAARGAFDIEIEVALRSAQMAAAGHDPLTVGRTRATNLYWTIGQMVAHHTSNGCNLEPGDLLGTGTISAPGREGFGSLMEITQNGREEFHLPTGEARRFLADGDEVIMTARCSRDGYRTIGFGECRAAILPARSARGDK